MIKYIYVLIGSTGKYSDYTEWIVIAYNQKEEAETHAKLATKEAETFRSKRDGSYSSPEQGSCKHDPNMQIDYNGTAYRVKKVKLI